MGTDVTLTRIKEYAVAVRNQTRDVGARKLCEMIAEYRPVATVEAKVKEHLTRSGDCPVCARRRELTKASVRRLRERRREQKHGG